MQHRVPIKHVATWEWLLGYEAYLSTTFYWCDSDDLFKLPASISSTVQCDNNSTCLKELWYN